MLYFLKKCIIIYILKNIIGSFCQDFFLNTKDHLPVGDVSVHSKMVKKQVLTIQPIANNIIIMLGLQETGELLQEVDTTMVSSS